MRAKEYYVLQCVSANLVNLAAPSAGIEPGFGAIRESPAEAV
jgi:hypothetical protein